MSALSLAPRTGLAISLFGASLIAPTTGVVAQPPVPDSAAVAAVRARYSKRELYLTMRDGTRLYANVYAPRDTTKRYPILLMRTPYSIAPYGADAYAASLGPWKAFQDDGYTFHMQQGPLSNYGKGYYQGRVAFFDSISAHPDYDAYWQRRAIGST